MECRNYKTPAGCKFGSKCHFIHSSSVSSKSPLPRVAIPARPPIVPSSSSQAKKVVEKLEQNHIEQRLDHSIVDSLWNFSNPSSGNEDGVFFYGAPGQFQHVDSVQLPYSKVAMLNVEVSENDKVDTYSPYQPSEICRFYMLGNCKFGSHCKYLHPQQPEALPTDINQTIEVTISSPIECGICIEAPKTALYGIMSHCDCVFCLDCIRNWRKEGLTIAKKADQVRLCPLCRTESYFVIPSGRYIVGEEKELLLQTYKESLAKKPCKHYASGDCPFGTSCFYMHDADGNSKKGFRKLFKSDEEVTSLSTLRLADYM